MTSELEVQGLGVRFQGLQALSDVSFGMRRGELTALIGPNGAGKSTLINVLCGTLPASTGRVNFQGRLAKGGDGHRLSRAGLVRTFQGLDLFESLSVEANVMAGGAAIAGIGFWRNLVRLPGADPRARRLRETAREAIDFVGLSHRRDDPASILPAGQRRLVAIARACATGAEWLVLDEPGAGLNETEKEKLIELVRRLHESGKTVLFVEHDMTVVRSLARRIMVLDRGRLIADGRPEVVRQAPEVISAYLGVETTRLTRVVQIGGRPKPLLQTAGLGVTYGDVWALKDLSLSVGAGELVAVVGANGAGKSTLLKTLAGVLKPREGRIDFDGQAVQQLSSEKLVDRGIALVPEGRELFASLSVEDNLVLGHWAHVRPLDRWGSVGARTRALGRDGSLEQIYALFPRLKERRRQAAGSLSGGEAQMVAIARALMVRPRLLLLDEPSLGLAPMLVEEILTRLQELKLDGLGILLVEQIARAALTIADYGYLLESGKLVAEGVGPELLDGGRVADAYLGAERSDQEEVRKVAVSR